MGIPPTETFNKVLCKSDEDEEVKKKLYNWWRSVFEILSKCKIPQERMDEFNEKVDDLMAEIMKAGDGAATDEELVAEEYEQATKDDEDAMLADMKFAIGKIGEIANKVQDLINFVNPYCGTNVNESGDQPKFKVGDVVRAMNVSGMDFYGRDAPIGPIVKIQPPHPDVGVYEYLIKGRSGEFFAYEDELEPVNTVGESTMDENEVREFVKAMGFRPDPDGNDYETQLVDALTGKNTDYNAGWGAVYYNSDKVLQFLKKFGMLGSRGIKQREAIAKLKRLFKSGKWKTEPGEFEFTEEEDNSKMTNETKNMGDDSEWVSMDDIVGMRIGESDPTSAEEVKWDDENSYNDGGFEKGMWVIWTDPDGGEESVWKILEMPENPNDWDAVYTLGQKDGSEVEVYGHEIRPRDSDPIEDDEEQFDEDGGALDDNQFHDYLMSMKPLKGDIFENYDVYNIDDGRAVELNVLVNKPRVSYAEVEQRYAPIAKNAGWKFVGFSYADKDDTVVAGNDDMCAINVKFSPATNQLNEENTKMKNELKKGDDGWKDIGQPVGEARVTVDVNDVWDVLELLDNDIANKELTSLINSHVRTEEEIMDAIDELSGDTISKQQLNTLLSGQMATLVDMLGLDVERYEDTGEFVDSDKPTSVELEGTDWKDITEKLTAEELADSIEGWEDRSKKLVVCDAFASGSDIVNVDVLTVTDKRDEVMKMASEYLLGNVENWQVSDASEPREDENGQFYTELILEPKYEEVAENNDEVKAGDVKDGEKQVTQGGDTKTLMAGEEKKPVCEMTIEQEVTDPWKLLNLLWGQGRENFKQLLDSNLFSEDRIMDTLEQFEIKNLTSLNDMLAYDFETVLDMFGCDVDAWNENLVIQKA